MRITRGNLSTIIREILSESSDDWMEDRHREDQSDQDYRVAVTIEDAVKRNPGISTIDLLADVQSHDDAPGPAFGPKARRYIFDLMDEMMREDILFFDEDEDAWFTTQKDLLAYQEGGTWSHQQDYDAGFKR